MEKYRNLMENDASQEERRNSKRAKRDANAILEGEQLQQGEKAAAAGHDSTAPTPTVEKALGPEKKGMSKKEMKKSVDARASEAQQHQQSVETARRVTSGMMSGRLFGAKKSYSWLNKATGSPGGFSTPARTAPVTPGSATDDRRGSEVLGRRRIGDWREDREKGAGIQLRDVLFTLEVDGRGARHVQKAYAKDAKEERTD